MNRFLAFVLLALYGAHSLAAVGLPGASVGGASDDWSIVGDVAVGGDLSVGNDPPAWGADFSFAHIGALGGLAAHTNVGGSNALYLTNNAYYDGSAWKYIADGTASLFRQINGGYLFASAVSGTADDNITFTTDGTISADAVTFSGAATFDDSGAFTGSLSTDVGVLATKDGSDSGGSGSYVGVGNAAASRMWLWQLDASNNLDLQYFNGSGYSVPVSHTAVGTTVSGTLTVGGNTALNGDAAVSGDLTTGGNAVRHAGNFVTCTITFDFPSIDAHTSKSSASQTCAGVGGGGWSCSVGGTNLQKVIVTAQALSADAVNLTAYNVSTTSSDPASINYRVMCAE